MLTIFVGKHINDDDPFEDVFNYDIASSNDVCKKDGIQLLMN